MAKPKTLYRCSECGGTSPVWAGRCNSCDEWNTLVEERTDRRSAGFPSVTQSAVAAAPIATVGNERVDPRSTGVSELDRVLGGGLTPGSVTLVGGEPGIGKSTLLLQAAAGIASTGSPVLYLTAEESASQVRARAERVGAIHDDLWLASETALDLVVGHLDAVKPAVVIIDSIQTLHDVELQSAPGSVAQVRECASRLVTEARARNCAVVLVGHVTKDGSLAGPRVLEHLVDTVLSFEGDRHHALRLLRAVKHRYGGTGELGVFEMADSGLLPVADPSAMFLADRQRGASGSVVTAVLDGGRPLLVEVQALLAETTIPTPRRSAQGFENSRLGMLLAVLEQRAGFSAARNDVWVTVAGGVRTAEPAVDLAVALAVASAMADLPVPADVIALGEVGLSGEIRQVSRLERRMAEAARLGFGRLLVPESAPDAPSGCEVVRVRGLREAIVAMGLFAEPAPRAARPSLVR